MLDVFEFADGLGLAKVIHVYEPSVSLKAVLVVDNVAKGPPIGGVRMAPDVSAEECLRLTRAMTLKNAAAGLPHGGGKAVLYGDPKMPRPRKEALIRLKEAGQSVADHLDGERLDQDAVVGLACDIWIPAARPDVIREDNVDQVKAKLVIEAANIPVTAGDERILHERGVLYIPDFIANAGGVICAAMEYEGASQAAALQTIEEKLRRNTRLVLEQAKNEQILPRDAANRLALERVKRAMSFRRYSLTSGAPGHI